VIAADTPSARVRSLYETTLKRRMAVLEASRQHVRWLFVQVGFFLIVPVVVLILREFDLIPPGYLPPRSQRRIWSVPFVALLAVCGLGVFWRGRILVPEFRGYRKRFKTEIMGEFFRAIVPMVNYTFTEGIDQSLVDKSEIFRRCEKFMPRDRLRGRLDGLEFEAGEAQSTYTRRNQQKRSETIEIFEGLFMRIELDRELAGRTFVDPESAKDTQLGEREGLERVEVPHDGFAKTVLAWSTDPAEARSLLTPTLVDQLATFKKRTGHLVFLSFMRNRANLAIHTGKSIFEPDIATTTTREEFEEMAEHFTFVEMLVRELRMSGRFRVSSSPTTSRSPKPSSTNWT
jgi:hypothetical protein